MTMAVAVSFILGVALGSVLGYVFPPGVKFWMGRREWKEAVRELELADRLLETLAERNEPRPTFDEDGSDLGAPVGRPGPKPW